jgi:plasmid stabilization system protein ParE
MMAKRAKLTDAAKADLATAYAWYERQLAGLGAEFLAEFRATTQWISAHPLMSAVIYREIRQRRLNRFSYVVSYRIDVQRLLSWLCCTVFCILGSGKHGK